MQEDNGERKRKLILISGLVIAVCLVIIATVVLITRNSGGEVPGDITDKGSYVDPNSGETVSDPPGKTPDEFGTKSDVPIFLGTVALIDQGVTKFQVDDYKYVLYNYFKSTNKKVSEISINIASIQITSHTPDTPDPDIATFDIVVDRKTTYKIKMEFSDITVIRLYLSDASGNLVHDSGTVDDKRIEEQ